DRAVIRGKTVSNVEIGDGERVLLDELAARLDLIAHQRREDIVRRNGVFDLHLHETATRRIDGGLPELPGVHFTEAFVALDRLALARLVEEPSHRFLEGADIVSISPPHHVRALADEPFQGAPKIGNALVLRRFKEFAWQEALCR